MWLTHLARAEVLLWTQVVQEYKDIPIIGLRLHDRECLLGRNEQLGNAPTLAGHTGTYWIGVLSFILW